MAKLPIETVDPELRAATLKFGANARVPDNAFMRAVVQAALRVVRFPIADGVRVRETRSGALRIRTYTPESLTSDGALLWIHGGGLVSGSPRQDDPLCSGTAAELGVRVFSMRYPLAPKHPFTAAIDHLGAGWRWTLDTAVSSGVDPARIVVGGESAGGGLAAALVQRIHDEGGVQPAGQWLFTPMLDDRTAARRDLDEPEHWIWSNRANLFGWSSYLGHEPGAESVPPYAVPARRESLAGLPPAFLTWGDIELFADEDRVYAERLRDAGVPVTTDVVAGAPHGFENWARDTAPAQALLSRAREWLRPLIG
ncbi:alpha/beta hydrolase [Microbacterium aoyamense]|uniref:Alpha/beta hydrolase n=1 Tax=Microbacterium aoyamense TaxID=344166 RepID=A0ABP5ANG7_9MICO|nr:alpha/beta hydrolase [Microbacterium aoyamense]